jgi:hypothetical protein
MPMTLFKTQTFKAKTFKAICAASLGLMLYLADGGGTAPGSSLLREARAVVGLPATPLSVAGVARRTTRRVVAVETAAVATTAAAATSATAQQQAAVAQQQAATAQQQAAAQRPAGAPAIGSIVTSLPPGCTQVTTNGVAYQDCGGVFYRAAFQGGNLIYVVAQP